MFIDEYVNELKLNGVCSQNNMRDCADSVQRNRIDGCRFLVSSLSWSNLRFWSILSVSVLISLTFDSTNRVF